MGKNAGDDFDQSWGACRYPVCLVPDGESGFGRCLTAGGLAEYLTRPEVCIDGMRIDATWQQPCRLRARSGPGLDATNQSRRKRVVVESTERLAGIVPLSHPKNGRIQRTSEVDSGICN